MCPWEMRKKTDFLIGCLRSLSDRVAFEQMLEGDCEPCGKLKEEDTRKPELLTLKAPRWEPWFVQMSNLGSP